jgi:hypothetical protein
MADMEKQEEVIEVAAADTAAKASIWLEEKE